MTHNWYSLEVGIKRELRQNGIRGCNISRHFARSTLVYGQTSTESSPKQRIVPSKHQVLAKWVIVVVASIAVLVLIAFIQTFRMERSKQALIHRSLHDALTGIPNRRAFDERLEQLLEEAKQQQTPLSLILIDVDAFKSYNDTYGHLKGDECLKEVARVLKRQARHGQVARYGGEEFTVLLSRGANETRQIAERIRQDILDLNIAHERYEPLCRVSVSLGLTSLLPGAETTEKDVIDQADQALYRQKKMDVIRLVI
ncbi:GGDEF domain-containing protein [Exiguobacterium sp. SL14]|nr:GGDEF domain-containing protein [Exiguobacterium sp. SL14]MCY1691266.1 GGDEF domain-containing protein [Exiguobacterium sp. SL14]